MRSLAQESNVIQNSMITYDIKLNTETWVDEDCGITSPTSQEYFSIFNITKIPTIRESWNWEASLISEGVIPKTLDIQNTTISVDMESMRNATLRLIEMPTEIYFKCFELQEMWNLFPFFLLISTQKNWIEEFIDSIFTDLYGKYGVSTPWYKLAAVYGLETAISAGWTNITEAPISNNYEEQNGGSLNEIFIISTFRGELSSKYEQYNVTRNPNLKINNTFQIQYLNGWLNGLLLSIDIDGSLNSNIVKKKFIWSIVRRDSNFTLQKIDDGLDRFLILILNNLILAFIGLILLLFAIFIIILKLVKRSTKKSNFVVCNSCSQQIGIESIYCEKCGKEINSSTKGI